MRKEKILLAILFLLGSLTLARAVYAYTGAHNFLSLIATTSDGHTYKSEYRTTGSFPFNGEGLYDGSPVSLQGTFNVYEADGVRVSESYCVKLSGTLSAETGQLTAQRYADRKCRQLLDVRNFVVSSFQEDSQGNFVIIASDGGGVVWTSTSVHRFNKRK